MDPWTSQYLRSLTSKKQPKAAKKRKLFEFQVPVLSLDVKKRREDISAAANATATVEQVVKFAGVAYRCVLGCVSLHEDVVNGSYTKQTQEPNDHWVTIRQCLASSQAMRYSGQSERC